MKNVNGTSTPVQPSSTTQAPSPLRCFGERRSTPGAPAPWRAPSNSSESVSCEDPFAGPGRVAVFWGAPSLLGLLSAQRPADQSCSDPAPFTWPECEAGLGRGKQGTQTHPSIFGGVTRKTRHCFLSGQPQNRTHRTSRRGQGEGCLPCTRLTQGRSLASHRGPCALPGVPSTADEAETKGPDKEGLVAYTSGCPTARSAAYTTRGGFTKLLVVGTPREGLLDAGRWRFLKPANVIAVEKRAFPIPQPPGR